MTTSDRPNPVEASEPAPTPALANVALDEQELYWTLQYQRNQALQALEEFRPAAPAEDIDIAASLAKAASIIARMSDLNDYYQEVKGPDAPADDE